MPHLDESRIAAVVRECRDRKQFPGAVILIGHEGEVVYHEAFGRRMITPGERPMERDTIFDVASVTKPVATATSVLQLLEQARLRLADPVQQFLPEFEGEHKDAVTIKHLLTHTSGLPAYFNFLDAGVRGQEVIARLCEMDLDAPPGRQTVYSCLGFLLLREIVGRVTGKRLDEYAREHIFVPLEMRDTMFCPPEELRDRCAATEVLEDGPLVGVVHDEDARALDGVGGNAGLFSTATDLSRFCQMILNLGELDGVRILAPATVRLATSNQCTVPGFRRGLGWDIDTAFSPVLRGDFFPIGSFGHSGFTGTSIWIDPFSQTYVIVLTNRCHPDRSGEAAPLRRAVANIAGAAFARAQPYVMATQYSGEAKTGLDVLIEQDFEPLRGLKLGVICNHTAITRRREHMLDVFLLAGLDVRVVFSPEHGFRGEYDELLKVPSTTDDDTGLTIHSLYSTVQRPEPEMLDGLDALVFDIQDIGVRFYTYTTTMTYCQEEAAKLGLRFFVLDRPNPINGVTVEGPVLDPSFHEDRKLSAYHRIPLRHGMTAGELALFANQEYGIDGDLTVIQCEGWSRRQWFDETGLPWVDPSPNIRNLTQATLYPVIGPLEAARISVGRGTDMPFEWFGAEYIDGELLARRLNEADIPHLRFVPVSFVPRSHKFEGEVCGGCYVFTTNRDALRMVPASLTIARTLVELYPDDFNVEANTHLIGSQAVVDALRRLDPVEEIVRASAPDEPASGRTGHVLYS